jgi:hypothetical protein
MRHFASFVLLCVGGCASSSQLAQQSNAQMIAANQSYAAGDYQLARSQQRDAEKLYQRATSRAYEEGRVPPPPPPTPPPLPVFDPQLEKHPR